MGVDGFREDVITFISKDRGFLTVFRFLSAVELSIIWTALISINI